ncbi:unnamed protein product [Fusarium graminearum]|uniref:Uncharacterized protein n=1 Tax=Gibberella zeae TaxID=5518 RepID=A0A4E9E8B0_GIBZA|nr:unnamed protein product [Fusarium graminearum]CAG2001184.1 unnamed protein product [Fusarium graminearum]
MSSVLDPCTTSCLGYSIEVQQLGVVAFRYIAAPPSLVRLLSLHVLGLGPQIENRPLCGAAGREQRTGKFGPSLRSVPRRVALQYAGWSGMGPLAERRPSAFIGVTRATALVPQTEET